MDDKKIYQQIQAAAKFLLGSKNTLIFSGAGISTPSGIPDFRSQDKGLWNRFNPMQTASLSAFNSSPEIFFNWLRPLTQSIWQAIPNTAHYAITDLEKRGLLKAVITQNIDGLHQKSGTENVIELHGNIQQLICLNCGHIFETKVFIDEFLLREIIPKCNVCGYILKPNIVLFEEMLPMKAWDEAFNCCKQADLMIVTGSSLEVSPANSLPISAINSGAKLIIVNLNPTELDHHASLVINSPVELILPKIRNIIFQ